jgi:hypothetical protein
MGNLVFLWIALPAAVVDHPQLEAQDHLVLLDLAELAHPHQ